MGTPVPARLLSADGTKEFVSPKVKIVSPNNPGAGADLILQPPVDKAWMPMSLKVTLATSATAASRIPKLGMDDGAGTPNELWQIPHLSSISASLTRQLYFITGLNLAGLGTVVDTDKMLGGCPDDIVVEYPNRLRTYTTAIQVGDQYSAAKLLVVEFDLSTQLDPDD